MGTITLTSPVAGTEVQAGLHATNYAALQALLNGNLDNANISTTTDLDATARVGVRKNSTGSTFERRRINLIEGSGVTLTVADDSGNEEVDVTIAAAGGTITTYKKTTQKDINTTTTETDLLNDEITIGAGAIGANGWIEGVAVGDVLNNVGGTTNLILRFKYGATTLWAETVVIPNLTTRMSWTFSFRMFNNAATNAQILIGEFISGSTGGAPTTGFGRITAGSAIAFGGGLSGTSSEDSTAAKVLKLTAEWAASSATRSILLDKAHFVVNQKA